MAELDFALLADYATVEGGKLTVVGGCYLHVWQLEPGPHVTYVAGRIRASDETEVLLGLSVTAPDHLYQITTESPLQAPDGPPYDGLHRSLVFAAQMTIPLVAEGRYELALSINGQPARTLAFQAKTGLPS
jgi:hypothetical protein